MNCMYCSYTLALKYAVCGACIPKIIGLQFPRFEKKVQLKEFPFLKI